MGYSFSEQDLRDYEQYLSDREVIVIKLEPGEHEAKSLTYWDDVAGSIVVDGGKKVRFEGAGKGKTVVRGGQFSVHKESAVELVGLTIADSPSHGVLISGEGTVQNCEVRGSLYNGVIVRWGGTAVLKGSSFHGNGFCGVMICDEGSALDMRKCFSWENKDGDEVEFDDGASASESTMEGNLFGEAAKADDPLSNKEFMFATMSEPAVPGLQQQQQRERLSHA